MGKSWDMGPLERWMRRLTFLGMGMLVASGVIFLLQGIWLGVVPLAFACVGLWAQHRLDVSRRYWKAVYAEAHRMLDELEAAHREREA